MPLLPENKLIWSPIVANSRMNRARNSSGINSYEQELKFKPEDYLEELIKKTGKAAWLDICCGEGKALIQTARYLSTKKLTNKCHFLGIDLLDTFPEVDKEISFLKFKSVPVNEWVPDQKYDLITCIHGLHYLGDKLKAIETVVSALTPSGLFIANLDLNNIRIDKKDSSSILKKSFKENGFVYNPRQKLLQKRGTANVHFSLNYLGADDAHGPNYTGQDSVASYYTQ
ncbi:MAG: hypothetical protein K0S32_375 [Bacteroidetes bacterium]|jgi:ubiquinone/menaquinone biosynthesis C-methylase UbiE|nr:hypothetical protein [Bacteroidota bacterium]